MPRLSIYSNFDYPDGEEQMMPWEVWTDEERSLVIKEGYKDLVLTSKQVKPYLDASRLHFWTQWIFPLAGGVLAFGPLRHTLLAKQYKMHPTKGFKTSALLLGGFSLLWLNLSPFFLSKESQQLRALRTMWSKVGPEMKVYNDMVPYTTTSTSLDKETWEIYQKRNCKGAGTWFPEEDSAPYILPHTPATANIKKIYL